MKEEYQPLDENAAMERAAANLDLASMHANRKKDIEGLITVAAAWIQISDRITEGFKPKRKATLGFGIEEEEEDDRTIINNSKSRSSIHPQPGELRKHKNRYWR